MITGYVRDNFGHVTLSLPGQNGIVTVEFIVDTGFDGELALPGSLVLQLVLQLVTSDYSNRPVRLADGSVLSQPYCELLLDWNDEKRRTEVLVLESNPLIGVELLAGHLLQIEIMDRGEVLIEPL